MPANRLQAVLDSAAGRQETAHKPKKAPPNGTVRLRAGRSKLPDKEAGTVLVGAHLPPAYNRQLRLLAAEEGATSNALIREALDLLSRRAVSGSRGEP